MASNGVISDTKRAQCAGRKGECVKQDSAEIRFHLAKLLESAGFKTSPTSSRLLAYLVDETLAGRAERLKGYSIGVDVFGRNADFDSAADSIVRVQMRRLRQLLADYYLTDEAKADRVIFVLEKGSYVPQFEFRSAGNAPVSRPLWANMRVWFFAILIMVILGGVVSASRYFSSEQRAEPKIFVSQFSAIDRSPESLLITRGLQHDLIALISQYPHLAVLGYDTVAGEGSKGRIGELYGADYILSGSVTTGGGIIKVASELSSVKTGLVVWSDTTEHNYQNVGDVLQSQSAIATRVGSVLGQPEGVIQQASKALIAESRGVSFANYGCIIAVYEYKRRKVEKTHRDMRHCLEKVTSDNRNYASAWALLSWVYGDEFRYGFNATPRTSPLHKSLIAAEKGVRANPFSATAHQYHAIALFYAGRDAEAKRAIENALRLSPNNAEILADAGWQDALAGESDDAQRYFDAALQLNPDPPSWYWGGLAINAIRSEDGAAALRFAELYPNDGILSLYVRAAALRLSGQEELANRQIADIGRSHPGLEKRGNGFVRRNRIDARFERWIFG